MPTRVTARPERPLTDPYGYAQGSIDYEPGRLPTNYDRHTCRCEPCVRHWVTQIPQARYNVENYRAPATTPVRRSPAWTYFGTVEPRGLVHPSPPSRWATYAQETPVPAALGALIKSPLRYILRRSGRVWSAEVECNDLPYDQAARVLGTSSARYSTRPDRATIISTPDGTVDAEIKISCMRDGSQPHAEMARAAYTTLVKNGATCAVNAGHHVHVDATRIADLGLDRAEEIMRGVWVTAKVCQKALNPLAASGYAKHRGQSHGFNEQHIWGRQAIHGGRLYAATRNAHDQNATIEYRLPNATLSPVRAQSFIAVPLGILDFVERAILDDDPVAAQFLQQARDRHVHANDFDELTAVSFLIDAVRFSKDSRKAMAIASYTSPSASAKATELWENAADGLPKRLSNYSTASENDVARKKAAVRKKAAADTAPRRIPARNSNGTFASLNSNSLVDDVLARMQAPRLAAPRLTSFGPAPAVDLSGVIEEPFDDDDNIDYEPDFDD